MERSTDDVAMVQLSISDASQVCLTALKKYGYSTSDAEMITEHLVDAELRGGPFAGLARALSIIDRLQISDTRSSKDIEVISEGAAFVRLDGHDAVGYLVAHRATELAIEKAKTFGVAVVGANNFWYSGNLAYYAEMATRQDLVCILASNTSPLVAPEGAVEARFGTNPICVGFPTSQVDRPVIWDIGTSNIMHAQIMRAQRLGIELPEGAAYSKDGQPSTYGLGWI
jgi:delta1-piperideine-2-carboxylate reductase